MPACLHGLVWHEQRRQESTSADNEYGEYGMVHMADLNRGSHGRKDVREIDVITGERTKDGMTWYTTESSKEQQKRVGSVIGLTKIARTQMHEQISTRKKERERGREGRTDGRMEGGREGERERAREPCTKKGSTIEPASHQ